MIEVPPDYRMQDEKVLSQTLFALASVRERLGGAPADWTVQEVGDGNLNLVFIVKGPDGGVAVKQALPYVRMVGESWPLPLTRSHYEHRALAEHVRLCPDLAPAIFYYDAGMTLLVMELLEPHVIMRSGVIDGVVYPRFAKAIARFLARTLYLTSDLAVPAAEKKARVAAFSGNTAMCRITEDLIFTEPYHAAPNNRWTSPHLDEAVASIRADAAVKAAVSRLKMLFLSRAEALLHGDLHTGSIMVTERDTRVIDAEFAFYGPMAFDVGVLLANLLIAYFAQDGHEAGPGERDTYRAWLLATTAEIWHEFRTGFLALWRENATGDAYPAVLFEDDAGRRQLEAQRQAFMDTLFVDAVGFAGAEIVRRVIGLAHTADFERIADKDVRSACEKRALRLARRLVVEAGQYRSIEAVVDAAILARAAEPNPTTLP